MTTKDLFETEGDLRTKGFSEVPYPSEIEELIEHLSQYSIRGLANYCIHEASISSNESKTLNYTLSSVFLIALKQAMQKYAIPKVIELNQYKDFVKTLLELNKKNQTGKFQYSNFWGSDLVQEYVELHLSLLPSSIFEQQRIRVKAYLRDYCPLYFTEHLVSNSEVHRKLQRYLEGEFHEVKVKKYHLDKYYTDLKQEYTSVTLNDQKGMTLDHIYQEPGFSVFNRCLTKEKLEKVREIEPGERFINAEKLDLGCDIHDFTVQWLEGKFIEAGFDNEKAQILLLYGYPGQGKTSFCKRLVYDLLREGIQEKPLYLIRFRNLERPEMLKSEVLNTIKDHLNERNSLALTKGDLSSSLLILDGLDELLMKNNLKTSDVDEIIRSLIYEIKLYPELYFIVTSRHGYLDHEGLKTSELLVLGLNEFDLTTQNNWLAQYHQFHPESWMTLRKLKELNSGQNYLKELLGQPILLHMIVALEEDITSEVPNRAKVYEHLFSQLTNPKKWKIRQIDVLDGLTEDLLRFALREIAFNIFKDSRGYIHKSQLVKLQEVIRLRDKLDGKGESFREALKVMMVAFYFQEIPKKSRDLDDPDNYDYAVEFLHKSLQEYLTAEYIWVTVQEEMLNTKPRGYVLDKNEKILEFLQSVFGVQVLSKEIIQYLVEIVANDREVSKKMELRTRFDEVFDYLIEKDFLHHFDAKDDRLSASVLSYSNFVGFWSIYSSLDDEIYLFPDEQIKRRTKFASFLRRITNLDDVPKVSFSFRSIDMSNAVLRHIDFSFSDLSTAVFHETDLSFSFLSGASLANADLTGANLFHAHLAHCDLTDSNLTFAHLYQVYLAHSDLSRAILSHAELSNAYLFDVNLTNANLEGSDLNRADLSNAILGGARLHNVNLSRADLTETYWGFADLEGADLSYAILKDVVDLLPEQIAKAANIEGVQGLSTEFLAEVDRIRNESEEE